MAFDVEPAPIARGRRVGLPIAAVVTGAIALVAVALLGGRPATSPVPATAAAALEAAPPVATPVARPPTAPAAPVVVVPVRLPRAIGCHDVAEAACRDLAEAGASVLPPDGTAIAAVDVWGSLLCGDELDCPRSRLAGTEPLGSVVVTFAGGTPSAWINVVERAPAATPDGPTPVAWIVRWQP